MAWGLHGSVRFDRAIAIASAIILLSLLCFAAKQFVMPAAHPAKTYAAHDEHPSEAITVAVDPYDTAEKAGTFTVHYRDIGMLPMLLVVTNDGDQSISLGDMKAQLVTADRTKISPAVPDDIFRRLSRPTASTNRYPLPFPSKKVKGGVSKEAREEIENSQFAAKAVEPHSTQVGFVFFDVEGIRTPLPGARFYLTGVRDSRGSEVMYFEVPLDKYLNSPGKP
jgi:hypothetical protein